MAEIAGFAPGGNYMSYDQTTMLRELDGMARTGARWMRVTYSWAGMEPRPGQWSFSKQEWLAGQAARRGIHIIADVAYTPTWAQPRTCRNIGCPPADPSAFGRFMRKLVSDMSPRGVKHYEIWNEPNMNIWWKPKPSPRAYTALLRSAYTNAKAVDRGVTIIAGAFAPAPDSPTGTSMRSTTYMRYLYADGAKGYFDAVSIHPYSGSLAPATRGDWNMMLAVAPDIHRTMVAHGDGNKKIWGTEMGYATSGKKAISERLQGLYIQQSYEIWTRMPYTAGLIVFNYRDMGSRTRASWETYGLVRRDFSPKASLPIFIQTMQMRQN
jgi:hypothetical protein